MAERDGGTRVTPDVGVSSDPDSTAHVVEFTLGDERCAIDIDSVDSIVETKQITRVPRSPDAVEGVMDLRGETTAVVDPCVLLAVEDGGTGENILVLEGDGDAQKIGIRVDEVTEVARYFPSSVDPSGDLTGIESRAIADDLITGVIRKSLGDPDEEDGTPEDVRLLLWFDIDALIDAVSSDRDARSVGDNQD